MFALWCQQWGAPVNVRPEMESSNHSNATRQHGCTFPMAHTAHWVYPCISRTQFNCAKLWCSVLYICNTNRNKESQGEQVHKVYKLAPIGNSHLKALFTVRWNTDKKKKKKNQQSCNPWLKRERKTLFIRKKPLPKPGSSRGSHPQSLVC